MSNYLCPACKLPLAITPDMRGQQVACPRCQFVFSLPTAAPRALPSASTPPLPPANPVLELSIEPMHTSYHIPVEPSVNILHLFDFSFKHYVTPLIVKITWVMALLLAVLWLGVVVFAMAPRKNRPTAREPTTPTVAPADAK